MSGGDPQWKMLRLLNYTGPEMKMRLKKPILFMAADCMFWPIRSCAVMKMRRKV